MDPSRPCPQPGWASVGIGAAWRGSWATRHDDLREGEDFPTAGHVVDYLRAYEQRYDLRVRRPVRVHEVRRAGERLAVETDAGRWLARYVISATGTWECPYVPDIPTSQSDSLQAAWWGSGSASPHGAARQFQDSGVGQQRAPASQILREPRPTAPYRPRQWRQRLAAAIAVSRRELQCRLCPSEPHSPWLD
ncbi:NAD(P)-binding domain-containing protein [Micromonospora sp. NBC_00898]|uniref:NAD(P)-binding domain-containing protein n=1 Tax=Micromonospora sp. NBC_00898 TaxID=2975981 RepID=UPI00386444A8